MTFMPEEQLYHALRRSKSRFVTLLIVTPNIAAKRDPGLETRQFVGPLCLIVPLMTSSNQPNATRSVSAAKLD